MFDFTFFLSAIALGIGLSMDAFSVSLANGLNEPCMKKPKMIAVAGTFAAFQAIMPFIGWFLVTTVVQYFKVFEVFIPYIALILLAFIGGKMIVEGVKNNNEENKCRTFGFGALIVQGIATSIDALSAGFTMASYNLVMAIVCVLVIAIVTFIICTIGVVLGKKFGTIFACKASIFGGIILLIIGVEIFISGII